MLGGPACCPGPTSLDAGAYARLHSGLPQVKIVGEDDYLGAWAVDGGIGMQWRDGHDWVAEVDLSPDMNAFKVCQPPVRRATCDDFTATCCTLCPLLMCLLLAVSADCTCCTVMLPVAAPVASLACSSHSAGITMVPHAADHLLCLLLADGDCSCRRLC